MPEIPDNLTLATGFLDAGADRAWALLGDPLRWPEVFPDWLTAVRPDDERLNATGSAGERYDLYPHPADDERGIDVEVVDELGSADVLRLRLIDARGGGCFVVVVASRLAGVSDADWQRVRDALRDGLAGLQRLV
jgi:hypothetical protein